MRERYVLILKLPSKFLVGVIITSGDVLEPGE